MLYCTPWERRPRRSAHGPSTSTSTGPVLTQGPYSCHAAPQEEWSGPQIAQCQAALSGRGPICPRRSGASRRARRWALSAGEPCLPAASGLFRLLLHTLTLYRYTNMPVASFAAGIQPIAVGLGLITAVHGCNTCHAS